MSSAGTQDASYHPPQKTPQARVTPTAYTTMYSTTAGLPQLSGYGSAAKAAE